MTTIELANAFFELSAELECIENQLFTLSLVASPRESSFKDCDIPADDCFRASWYALEHHVKRLGEELADGPNLENLDELTSEIASVSDALYLWQVISKPSKNIEWAMTLNRWDDALWNIELHLERIGESVYQLGMRLKKGENGNAEKQNT